MFYVSFVVCHSSSQPEVKKNKDENDGSWCRFLEVFRVYSHDLENLVPSKLNVSLNGLLYLVVNVFEKMKPGTYPLCIFYFPELQWKARHSNLNITWSKNHIFSFFVFSTVLQIWILDCHMHGRSWFNTLERTQTENNTHKHVPCFVVQYK